MSAKDSLRKHELHVKLFRKYEVLCNSHYIMSLCANLKDIFEYVLYILGYIYTVLDIQNSNKNENELNLFTKENRQIINQN